MVVFKRFFFNNRDINFKPITIFIKSTIVGGCWGREGEEIDDSTSTSQRCNDQTKLRKSYLKIAGVRFQLKILTVKHCWTTET